MKKAIQIFKQQLLFTCFIGCIILYSSCSLTHNTQSTLVQKKWINWKITFKENISEKEKNIEIASLEKYILTHLSRLENQDIIYDQITFNREINNTGNGILSVSTISASVGAAPTPVVGPKPPKIPGELFPNLVIEEIRQ